MLAVCALAAAGRAQAASAQQAATSERVMPATVLTPARGHKTVPVWPRSLLEQWR